MNDFHFMRYNDFSVMNLAYVMAAICVVYKLAFIARQVSFLSTPIAYVMRTSCLVVGTIILVKAYGRIEGHDPASLIDVLRELSWCAFLASSIIVLRDRLGRW